MTICLFTVASPLFFFAGNVLGGDDSRLTLKACNQAAIDYEINSCQEKKPLQNSRSGQLQRKGHLEASKAQFLMANRESLIKAMMRDAHWTQAIQGATFSERYVSLHLLCAMAGQFQFLTLFGHWLCHHPVSSGIHSEG